MNPNQTKPSAAALRAAKAVFPAGCASYCYDDPEKIKAAMERDWSEVALIIETETGLREMAEALERISNQRHFFAPWKADSDICHKCRRNFRYTMFHFMVGEDERTDMENAKRALARYHGKEGV